MSALTKLSQELFRWSDARGFRRPRNQIEMKALLEVWALANGAMRPPSHIIGDAVRGAQPDPVANLLGHHDLVTHDPITEIVDPIYSDPGQDDFYELIHNRNHAMHEGGGDDLARDVIMQQQDRAALHDSAPFVRSAPPSIAQAVLGSTATITAGQPTVNVARWQGDDSETTPITVTAGRAFPAASTALSAILRPFLLVKFGTRAVLLDAEVDLTSGTQFVVSGSTINVDVGLEVPGTPNTGIAAGNLLQQPIVGASYTLAATPGGITGPPTAQLSAMLSFRSILKATPTYRTRYGDNVPDGGNILFSIPKFASQVFAVASQHGSSNAGAKFAVTYQDFYGNPIGCTRYITDSGMLNPLPVPGDAVLCRFDNNTGGGTAVDARLIFSLHF